MVPRRASDLASPSMRYNGHEVRRSALSLNIIAQFAPLINTRVISQFENVRASAWHCARARYYIQVATPASRARHVSYEHCRSRLTTACTDRKLRFRRRERRPPLPAGRCIHRSLHRIYREIDTRAYPPTRSVYTFTCA